MAHHPELQTIRDYIRFATSRFHEAGLYYGHGTDNAWDEAILLVLRSLHLPHDINAAVLDAHLTKDEQIAVTKLIEKRANERIPVSYLIHEAWFAGLSFYVDERVLIPRSPIAELIENQFSPWLAASVDEVENILDLCTGSGCIAIACAKAFPEAKLDASDISVDALAVAKINVLRHGVESQVTLHQSDLFDALPPKQYDIIVTNPPYVSLEEMATLPPEYTHEPELGLAAGKEGLDFVMRILREAKRYLKSDGLLVVEVGNSEEALAKRFPHIPFTWMEFQHDSGGVFVLTAKQLEHALDLSS
jgi:ribosomal protein L3 glutamine methyltransferase